MNSEYINKNSVKLEFPSEIIYTDFCIIVLNHLKDILKIDEDTFFKIEISLREAVNNAIVHGNGKDLNKKVKVEYDWNKEKIRIKVKDESKKAVDFEKVEKNLEENDLLSFSGRGILIMRSYMDRVDFKYNKGTEILLEKKI